MPMPTARLHALMSIKRSSAPATDRSRSYRPVSDTSGSSAPEPVSPPSLIQLNAQRRAVLHMGLVRYGHHLPDCQGKDRDMRASPLLLAAVLLAGYGLPALATPCAQHVGALQRRLDSVGAVHVAGLEPGHTLTTGSVRALPRALADQSADPQLRPTRENIAAARLLIREASAEEAEGNQRACENILSDAKRLIGALP